MGQEEFKVKKSVRSDERESEVVWRKKMVSQEEVSWESVSSEEENKSGK